MQETRALIIGTEAQSLDTPKLAMLMVRTNGLGLFYASGMQSHNGFTVFTDCYIPEEVCSTVKMVYHVTPDEMQSGLVLFSCKLDRPCKCLCHVKHPLVVVRTENVLQVLGLINLDKMPVWFGIDKASAIEKMNVEQIECNRKAAQANSSCFIEAVSKLMVVELTQGRKNLPWHKRLFLRKPIDEASLQLNTKGPFFRQCARKLARSERQGLEFDRPILIEALGFDPWKDE